MAKKPEQVDLEQAIAARNSIPVELVDAFTGEVFKPRSRNHYEHNDGVPFAPPVDLNRPSIRQRIENLLNRDPGLLQRYMMEGPPDGQEGIAMDVPDDPEEPLTASEQNHIDVIAAELAEAAPLPDEGLPRPAGLEPDNRRATAPERTQDAPVLGQPLPKAGDTPGGGGTPAPAPAAAPAAPVPTR